MKANYSAAIVYNDQTEELIAMAIKGNNPNLIPSVFIGHSDAVSLLEQFTFITGDRKYVVRLTYNAPSQTKPYILPVRCYEGGGLYF